MRKLRSTGLHCSARSPGERGELNSPLGELSSLPGLPRPWLVIYGFVPEDWDQGLSDKGAVYRMLISLNSWPGVGNGFPLEALPCPLLPNALGVEALELPLLESPLSHLFLLSSPQPLKKIQKGFIIQAPQGPRKQGFSQRLLVPN